MKKVKRIIILFVVIVFIFTSVFAVTPKNSSGVNQSTKESNQVSRFIVKYKDSNQSVQLSKKMKNKLEKNKKIKNNLEMLETKSKMTVAELMKEIEDMGLKDSVQYVQEDTIIKAFEENPVQDEKPTVTGEVYGGNEILIYPGLEQVWGLATGEGAVVGVIDTGIDISHEDLKNNIWVNNGEIPGDGIDQDGNGYTDDVNGWNFAGDNNSIYDENASTDEEHGTAIAGIIAAEKDNGAGIAGTAPRAKLMPLKVFKNGQAYTSDIIEAIEYAGAKGVKIINCSWGTGEYNQALKDAMAYSGMLFICAAGNSGADLQQSPVYPACFGLGNIISTASINSGGGFSSFSNYSSSAVDIAAPGEEIISTIPGNRYSKKNGTSIAAAFVSGEAALVTSKYKEAAVQEVKNRIVGNADKVEALESKVRGGSLLNCAKAITGDNIPVDSIENSTVTEAVYADNLGFSLLSMEEGYSAPQDVTAPVISLPANTVNGQMRMSVLGNTLTNMLGDVGDFEKDSNNDGGADGWGFSSSVKNGLSTDSVIGNYSQSVKANATNNERYFYIQLGNSKPKEKPDTYYLVSGYVKIKNNENISSSSITIVPNGGFTFCDGTTFKRNFADVTKLNSWQKIGTAFKTLPDMSASYYIALAYLSGNTSNAEFLVDGICSYEITEEEYNTLSVDQLLEKYNYVENTKSTGSKTIKSIGKNLCPDIGNWELVNGAAFSDGYISLPNSNSYAVSPFIKWGKRGDAKFEGTFNCTDASGTKNIKLAFNYYDSNFKLIRGNGQAYLATPINTDYIGTSYMSTERGWYIADAEYVKIFVQRSTTYAPSPYKFKNILLTDYGSDFGYEPYYESTVSTPDTELRSLPNGVKDEIDLNNGIYIKRVDVTSEGTLVQLAQPEVQQINIQSLACFENGTITVENIIKAASNYNAGISIKNANLPIKEIENIYKIDGALRIPVSTGSAAIASDGLSFTITGAQNGDVYEYVYRYADELSTLPTIRYSVPTDLTSQSNGNTEAINMLQTKVDNLEQRIKALEDLIKNGIGSKNIEFQYDANGNLQAIIAK